MIEELYPSRDIKKIVNKINELIKKVNKLDAKNAVDIKPFGYKPIKPNKD